MEYQDKTATCVETVCGHAEFVITASEQSFFAGKGFPLPKRCKPCRERKKQEKLKEEQRAETRRNSPFTPLLNEMKTNPDHPLYAGKSDHFDRKGRKPKKGWKHNRRHGREAIGNFEGEGLE